MKQVYEEPMMVIMVLENMDIVTLSGDGKEPGTNQGSYSDMFGTE